METPKVFRLSILLAVMLFSAGQLQLAGGLQSTSQTRPEGTERRHPKKLKRVQIGCPDYLHVRLDGVPGPWQSSPFSAGVRSARVDGKRLVCTYYTQSSMNEGAFSITQPVPQNTDPRQGCRSDMRGFVCMVDES
jgi:hypothetical protein